VAIKHALISDHSEYEMHQTDFYLWGRYFGTTIKLIFWKSTSTFNGWICD